MQLTTNQEKALKLAVARYRVHEAYTCIAGYAGSGKSTTISFIISALNLDPEEQVAYISYTGKASEVLRNKGCPNAMTAHRLLYHSKQLPNGRYLYRPRQVLDKPYKVIVVDEISMLPKDMWELLLSHHVYVIAVGDPFQLPPISREQDNHILDNPHIFLDEIMRQAKESDIIISSMDIREGRKLKPKLGNDIQIFKRKDLVTGMYDWADQIIVAKNQTRTDINEYMRASQGRGAEPEIEDKVICLHNAWDICSEENNNPLINGTIGYLGEFHKDTIMYYLHGREVYAPVLIADLKVDDDIYKSVIIDYNSLVYGRKFFTPEQEYYLKKDKRNPILPIEFNYGYSITCHKSQGSQWDKVLILEENFPFEKEEHARWLYTGVTRGSKRVTLILR